jgi:transposase-like protein
VPEIARRHDIDAQQLFRWLRWFRAEAEALIEMNRAASEPGQLPF